MDEQKTERTTSDQASRIFMWVAVVVLGSATIVLTALLMLTGRQTAKPISAAEEPPAPVPMTAQIPTKGTATPSLAVILGSNPAPVVDPVSRYNELYQRIREATQKLDYETIDSGLQTAKDNHYTTIVAELDQAGWVTKLAEWKYQKQQQALVAQQQAVQAAEAQKQLAAQQELDRNSIELDAVSPNALVSAYTENEVRADSAFKGKWCIVSGPISGIGKDIVDTPYVTFKGGESFRDVQCMFSKEDESQLINLNKGAGVSVAGEVSGLMGNVLLRNCKIVPYTFVGRSARVPR
jgi:hypothetical protein